MARQDEGPLDTVGWGPFALRSERKRLRVAEERRMAEVAATRQAGPSTVKGSDAPTARLAALVARAASLAKQKPLGLAEEAELHGIAEILEHWDAFVQAWRDAGSQAPQMWEDHVMSAYRSASDTYFKAEKRRLEDDLLRSKAAAARETAAAIEAAREAPKEPLREVTDRGLPASRTSSSTA
jgi:hypothetical protein